MFRWIDKAGKLQKYLLQSTQSPGQWGSEIPAFFFSSWPNSDFERGQYRLLFPGELSLCWKVEFFRNFSLTLALADKIMTVPKTTSLGICCSWAQRYWTFSTTVHTANGSPRLINGRRAMKTDNAQLFFSLLIRCQKRVIQGTLIYAISLSSTWLLSKNLTNA